MRKDHSTKFGNRLIWREIDIYYLHHMIGVLAEVYKGVEENIKLWLVLLDWWHVTPDM